MTSLYNLTLDVRQRIDALSDADWLDDKTLSQLVTDIKADALQKQQNLAAYVLNLESDIEQMKSYVANMELRIKTSKFRSERLRNTLLWSMRSLNQDEVKCDEFTLKIKENPLKVVINNDALIPDEFMRVKTVTEPDKARIKEELTKEYVMDNGNHLGSVPGCHLESGERLEIK